VKKRKTINGDCFILLRHTYRNHLEEFHDYTEEIGSVPSFKNTMHWHPEMAEALGLEGDYRDKRHFNPRISNVRLAIRFEGKEIPLQNIDQLTAFLDSHPAAADALQYKASPWLF
jgi:hypothetical protein